MHVQKMNKNYVNTKIKQKLEKTNQNNTKAQEKGNNTIIQTCYINKDLKDKNTILNIYTKK